MTVCESKVRFITFLAWLLFLWIQLPGSPAAAQLVAKRYASIMRDASAHGHLEPAEMRSVMIEQINSLRELVNTTQLAELVEEKDVLAYSLACERTDNAALLAKGANQLRSRQISLVGSHSLLIRLELKAANGEAARDRLAKLKSHPAYLMQLSPYWFAIASQQLASDPESAVSSALKYIDTRVELARDAPPALALLSSTIPIFSRQILRCPSSIEMWQEGLQARFNKLEAAITQGHLPDIESVRKACLTLQLYGANAITSDRVLRSTSKSSGTALLDSSFKWNRLSHLESEARKLLAEAESASEQSKWNLLAERCRLEAELRQLVDSEYGVAGVPDRCVLVLQRDKQAAQKVNSSLSRIGRAAATPFVVAPLYKALSSTIETTAVSGNQTVRRIHPTSDFHQFPDVPICWIVVTDRKISFAGAGFSPHLMLHVVRSVTPQAGQAVDSSNAVLQ
jgi:hypothetical protein